jgi:hypothetical protein
MAILTQGILGFVTSKIGPVIDYIALYSKGRNK